MSTLTLIKSCTLTGHPPEGQWMVLDNDGIQRVYGLPPEMLPPCSCCGAPTVVDGEIIGKYFYARPWPLRRIWCIDCVPWWVQLERTFSLWRWKLLRVPACRPWYSLDRREHR